jgi:hypothetical protein
MALVQGKLVHDQPPYALCREVAVRVLQPSMVDLFDGMPVQPSEAGYMGNGKQLSQRFDPETYAVREVCPTIEPSNMLGNPGIAMMAVQTPHRHIEPDALVQNVAVAHLTSSTHMHQDTGLPA